MRPVVKVLKNRKKPKCINANRKDEYRIALDGLYLLRKPSSIIPRNNISSNIGNIKKVNMAL
jgi:hypothetical protein